MHPLMSHSEAKTLGAKILLLPRTLNLRLVSLEILHASNYLVRLYFQDYTEAQDCFALEVITTHGAVTFTARSAAENYIKEQRTGIKKLSISGRGTLDANTDHLSKRMAKGIL